MPRILQLIDRDSDFETQRSVEAIGRALAAPMQVITRTIGRGGDYRDAFHAAAMLRREAVGIDILHAWGTRPLLAATFVPRVRLIFSPNCAADRRTIRWLRAAAGYRPITVVSPTETMHRCLATRGVAECHVLRPGVDFSRLRQRRKPELRRQLGFDEKDRVILALGESTRPAAHGDAAWAAGILHVSDPRYRLLIWGRGPLARLHMAYREKWRLPRLITAAPGVEYESLLGVADLALVSARGSVATLPIACAMAAGLPIIATATSEVGELLEDRHTALLTQPGRPRLLAQRILDLEADQGLRCAIADRARAEAYDYFSLTRFLADYRKLYGGEPLFAQAG